MLKALRSKLAVKIIAGIVLAMLIFAVLSSLIGYQAFADVLEQRYADTGYRIGRLAAQVVDGDKIDSYLDPEYRKTEEYKNTMRRLDNITQRMNAAFIYVLQPMDDDWNEVIFLFETVNDNYELSPYLPGHVRESASEEYSQKYALIYDGKSEEECVFRSARQTTTGAHVSSLVPVKNSDGESVGVLCVQLQEVELRPARNKLLREIAGAALIMILLVSVAYGWLLRKTVAKPIRHIASETVRFSRDNELPEVSLTDSTPGNDEIKLLAMHVDKMEFAIMNYTENLKTVTSQKDRMEGELNVASGIQQGIIPNTFPPFPERDEFSLYAHMTPAKEVGGDFYDFFFIDDDHLGLVIADVSGKGAPAALFMMATKIMVKNRAQLGGTPAEVLADVNQQLCEGNYENMFVTAWFGILEVSTGVLTTANAGHEYPALCHADGTFEFFKDKHGFVLGGMSGTKYREEVLTLQPGDTLFVYTDGVTEATDRDLHLFGTERLLETLNVSPHAAPDELLGNMAASIHSFANGMEQADDITMLALQYHGQVNHLRTLRIDATRENLTEVSAWIEEMLQILDVPMKEQMQIQLAAEEIYINVANYAYAPGVGPVIIRIGYDMDRHAVKMAFVDQGMPYDPLAKEDPDTTLTAEEREVGGLGIFLVKKTMDNVHYVRSNHANVLTFEKLIDRADDPIEV